VDVSGAVIGEHWRVGEKVLLEVTAPRTPCGTFERRMGIPRWQDRFAEHGAPGAYFRVIRAGDVAAGDPIEVLDVPAHGVTVAGWFSRQDPADAQRLLEAADEGLLRLHEGLRQRIDRALSRSAR
jgi:MOSC domain-containing protein YiiM